MNALVGGEVKWGRRIGMQLSRSAMGKWPGFSRFLYFPFGVF